MRTRWKQLVDAFPLLYRGEEPPYGFAVGEGWYGIIWELSAKLEKILLGMPEADRPTMVQVKEKFGGLRFYLSHDTDEIDMVVREAEAEAWKTCETCGAEGKNQALAGGYWLQVLCERCAKMRTRS